MEALLLLLSLIVALNYALKQAFMPRWAWGGSVLLIVGASFLLLPLATSLSKTQVLAWMRSPAIMTNISGLITVDVALQLAFCYDDARIIRHDLPKWRRVARGFLRFYPGLMMLPVGFAGLTYVVFSQPGVPFMRLAAIYTLALALVLILAISLLTRQRADHDTRREVLFLSSLIEAILGIVVTVNGATAVSAVSSVDWSATALVLALLLGGGALGLGLQLVGKPKDRFSTNANTKKP